MTNPKNLYKKVLLDKSFSLLENLQTNPTFDDFYLAGGTSLALQLGHRLSEDLDFFSPVEFKSVLVNSLGREYKTISIHDNNIEILVEETKVFFMYFAYPLYKPLIKVNNLRFADPIDIGLMKLLALSGRTTRKDIIDLYFIDKEIISLQKLLKIFDEFYPKDRVNSYDSMKRLLNKEVLDAQPRPKMLAECEWENCYKIVSKAITDYSRKSLS